MSIIKAGEIMDIRCRKTLCRYNDRYTCKAKGIKVTNKATCRTYEKGDKAEVDTTKHLFEKTPEYAPQRDSKTLEILCHADCLFNKDGKCVSNGITVNSITEKPFCVSYLQK